MAGPIRRLIQRKPVRNAVRRMVGLPEIAGRSSAMQESATGGRLLGRRRIQQPQFRTMAGKSVNADLRGVNSKQETPIAQPQADADSPDVTPDRVFPQSDPDKLNKMAVAGASDAAQKTDLDAGPRKVGGAAKAQPMSVATSGGAAATGISNSTEVRVQPSEEAVRIRVAREEDAARQKEKTRAAEGFSGAGTRQPGQAATKASVRTEGQQEPQRGVAGPDDFVPLAIPDMAAHRAEIERLMAAEQRAEAGMRSIESMGKIGTQADPTNQLMLRHQMLQEEAARARTARYQLMAQVTQMPAAMALKNSEMRNQYTAAQAQLVEARSKEKPSLNDSIGQVGKAAITAGAAGAASASAAQDISGLQNPTAAVIDQVRQANNAAAAAAALSQQIGARVRLTSGHPVMVDITRFAYEAYPADPDARKQLLRQYAAGAMQQAAANGATFQGDANQLADKLSQMVEENIAAMPKKKGFFTPVWDAFRGMETSPQAWGSGQ